MIPATSHLQAATDARYQRVSDCRMQIVRGRGMDSMWCALVVKHVIRTQERAGG